MSRRRKSSDSTPFDTLRLEGSLFVPELLERAARGEATAQKETDYAVPKGLKLHDEYGRAFRIACALWQDFAAKIPRADLNAATTTQAFVLDLLRDSLGYADLTPQGSPVSIGDRGFPITAQALGGRLPIIIAPHTLGLDDPDPRFAIHGSGSRKKSAYQLAQEYLNASRDCLWAIVTNGRTLRLLRDAESLTRPNFLEFDLETILRESADRYADFSALWRLLHVSRAGQPEAPPADCVWEKWKSEGHAQGLRVRDGLRDGVQEALLTLGGGFLAHPENTPLRQRLQDGSLTKEDYFQQLLRLIYRSLFLFCAEERDLLHPPETDPAARTAYGNGYSLRRLRRRCLRHTAHDPHGDLWLSLRIVFHSLATGQPRLALPALGGLFAETQCPDLDSACLTNRDLLSAMRPLRWFSDRKTGKRSAIDYRNMGPEELGSVYESLLELVPQLDLPARTFGFAGITDTASTSGNARKTTGSYYTPDSLVQELIKSALDPVIADRLAAQPDRPIDALLSITVCDPSCGSGHFLLAAARRLAEKLAELRAPDGAVRPDDYRHALREVASRCLYGVDINPMAVELCRVALWLETVDPGKPLGFLNHHIRTGNSLLGTTPDLIAAGLPDDTFTAIEGDDKPACAELKKRNKKEREGFGPLFEQEEQTIRDRLRLAATQIEAMDDSQPAGLQQKEAAFTTSETAPEYRHAKLLADLWCAAFVIKKTYPASDEAESPISNPPSQIAQPIEGHLLHTDDDLFGQSTPAPAPAKTAKQPRTKNQEQGTASGITTAHLRDFVQGKPLPDDLQTEVEALARQYRFFHWHLAFPQVFDQGGFACILGNPPWEKMQLEERQFFATFDPRIAEAGAKERKRLIAELRNHNPSLFCQYEKELRSTASESNLLRFSEKFPQSGQGNLTTHSLFLELGAQLISRSGKAGLLVPSGLATQENQQGLFRFLVGTGRLRSLFDFENSAPLFPGVHRSYRFCMVTIGGGRDVTNAQYAFFLSQVDELQDSTRHFSLDLAELERISPNTLSCPAFRNRLDALVTAALYRRTQIIRNDLTKTNPWGWVSWQMLNETHEAAELNAWQNAPSPTHLLPLYEGKFIHQFDHRYATFGQAHGKLESESVAISTKTDPFFCVTPRFGVRSSVWAERVKARGGATSWVLAFRLVARSTDERTAIFAILPKCAASVSIPMVVVKASAVQTLRLLANLNSFAFDFTARLRATGISLNHFMVHQLPVVGPEIYLSESAQALADHTSRCAMELTYTAWDLEAFASDCGWSGPPFRWDEERRFLLRCELDAAFFHLYLGPQSEWQQQPEALTRAFPSPRHAVSYIMDTFPIVKRKDEAKHGHYRTKETILQIYDSLGEAMQTGEPYQTLLSPPPADAACCHPPKA